MTADLSEYETVLVEHHGPVTVLTLNRPDRLNALSHQMIRDLDRALDRLLYDYPQRVLVLTGAGRAFCAGIDLVDQSQGARWIDGVGDVQAGYGLQEAVGRLVVKLRRIPQPVIAVVNGVAAGGGLSLSLTADVRVVEPTARFVPAFVKLGVSGGDMGSSWFLPRVVGYELAAEMLYTGRELAAEEALAAGLAGRSAAAGDGVTQALELAEQMCRLAPFSHRMTKSLLNLSRDGASLEQMIELENRTQSMMVGTADFREAVAAFVQRRPAEFHDR